MQTTFMDLIRELGQLTHDDGMVIAAVKRVFNSHTVRLTHSLAPVRLVSAGEILNPVRAGAGELSIPACHEN